MAFDRKILNLKFNQDQTCFTCCMENGVRVYNVQPLMEKTHYDIHTVGSVSHAELINRSNLVAIVSGGNHPKFSDNVLSIYDDVSKKIILQMSFKSSIRAVRIRRDKLVVALLNQILIYSFPAPTQRLFSLETRDNHRGLCEITPLDVAEKQILIFPGHILGSVQLFDLSYTEIGISSAPTWIPAHKSELECLSVSRTGTKIATASHKGTLIRVWDSVTKQLIVELRRGSDAATVYCLNFSKDEHYLCCSSDKGTVHIFALKNTNYNKRISLSNVGILGKYGESQWALANFTVPLECACICAFGPEKSVIAICKDGGFHKYVFTNDGNCNREAFDVYLDVADDSEETLY